MAASTINYAYKTVNGRTIASCMTVTATDDDTNGTAFTVLPGQSVTLVAIASAVGTGSAYFKLQGSIDGVNWVTLKSILMDSNIGASADLAAAGAVSKTHDPSANGDFPYYRVASDQDTGGSAFVGYALINPLV